MSETKSGKHYTTTSEQLRIESVCNLCEVTLVCHKCRHKAIVITMPSKLYIDDYHRLCETKPLNGQEVHNVG